MNNYIDYIVKQIETLDAIHAKRIKRDLKSLDAEYLTKAEGFFCKVDNFLKRSNKTCKRNSK